MKKKTIWIVVTILIVLAILAVASLGIIYFKTDLFKSEQDLFYKHLASSTGILEKTSYTDMVKQLQESKAKSSEVAGEITLGVKANDVNSQQIAQVLDKGKITYNVKSVGQNKQMQGDITLNYDGKDVVTLNVLQNGEQYGVKVSDVYDKYVSVENNNLKALFQKLGVNTTDIPDKIEGIDAYELLNIDEETIKYISDTYLGIIKENIPKESYSVERNIIAKINGEDITTNAYKLTISQEQIKTVMIKIFETLKTDDRVLDLFLSKYNVMVKPAKLMGTSEVEEITKQDLVDGIDEMLEELNDITASDDNALEITVCGEKDNKSKIIIEALDDNDISVMSSEIVIYKDANSKNIVSNITSDGTVIEISAKEAKEETNFEMSINAEGDKIAFTLDNKGNKVDSTFEIESDDVSVSLNVSEEVKDTQNVVVEDFTTENSVKLNDMSQEELQTLVQTIYTNVMQVLPQKAQLLGINLQNQ